MVGALLDLPKQAEKVLTTESKIKDFAQDFQAKEDIFFIGRGLDYAVSLEGALKLKEISYIHAEAYAAGELKHGTLALIVAGGAGLRPGDPADLYEKMLSNIKEVKARDATVVALVNSGDLRDGEVGGLCPVYPQDASVLHADSLRHSAAALCLLRGQGQGMRCRQTAQSGQERHGGVDLV